MTALGWVIFVLILVGVVVWVVWRPDLPKSQVTGWQEWVPIVFLLPLVTGGLISLIEGELVIGGYVYGLLGGVATGVLTAFRIRRGR